MRARTQTYIGTRVFGVATDAAPSRHLNGPACQDCHLPIFYAVDCDRWFHRDPRLVDHEAHPETVPRS